MNLAITGAELKLPNVPQSPNAGPTLLRAEMQAATDASIVTPEIMDSATEMAIVTKYNAI